MRRAVTVLLTLALLAAMLPFVVEQVRSYSDTTLSFKKKFRCLGSGPCQTFLWVELHDGVAYSDWWINHTGSSVGPWVLEIAMTGVKNFTADGDLLWLERRTEIFADPSTLHREWMRNRAGPGEFLIWVNQTTHMIEEGELRNIPEPKRVTINTTTEMRWDYDQATETMYVRRADNDNRSTVSNLYDVSYRLETGTSGPNIIVDFSWTVHDLEVCFIEQTYGTAEPVGFEWRFGDGSKSQKPDPCHTYARPGNYNVTLRVWDARHDLYERTKTVGVPEPPVSMLERLAPFIPFIILLLFLIALFVATRGRVMQFFWTSSASRKRKAAAVSATIAIGVVLLYFLLALGAWILLEQAVRVTFGPLTPFASLILILLFLGVLYLISRPGWWSAVQKRYRRWRWSRWRR